MALAVTANPGLAVVVFSPHALRRSGLEVALSARPEVALAAMTGDSTDLVTLVRQHRAVGVIADLEGAQDHDLETLKTVSELPGHPVSVVCFAQGDIDRIADVASFAFVLDPRDGIDLVIAALQSDPSATQAQRREKRRDIVKLTSRNGRSSTSSRAA
jgi:DNA-binding NarL/FixJ family response regulator